jgi:hypothetical protein
MDYKDDTNYWSRCSVEDFTKTKKSCLAAATSECSSGTLSYWRYIMFSHGTPKNGKRTRPVPVHSHLIS